MSFRLNLWSLNHGIPIHAGRRRPPSSNPLRQTGAQGSGDLVADLPVLIEGHSVRVVDLQAAGLEQVEVGEGEAVLLENVRFNLGEKADDESLARRMAKLCRVFVMDERAFNKEYTKYYNKAMDTHGVQYTRCRVSAIGGITQAESPEWTPAYSMCCMTAGTKASVPSEMASASASMAFARNLSTRIGRCGLTNLWRGERKGPVCPIPCASRTVWKWRWTVFCIN